MSDDTRTIEQKLDAFVDGNIKPWLRARLREERLAGERAAHESIKVYAHACSDGFAFEAPTTPYAAEDHEDAEVTQWHDERELPTELGAVILVDSVYYPGDEGRGTPAHKAVHIGDNAWALEGGMIWPRRRGDFTGSQPRVLSGEDITEWREISE